MNADLTFNSIVLKKAFDERAGSERVSTARAINTPDKLVIKTQTYTDTATKIAGTRHMARVDRWDVDANGDRINTAIYVVAAVPETATSAQVSTTLATFKAVVADADFLTAVLNGEK